MQVNSTEAKLIAIWYIIENGYERSSTPNKLRRFFKRELRNFDLNSAQDYEDSIEEVSDWVRTKCISNSNWQTKARDIWNSEEINIADNNSNYDDLPMLCSIIYLALIEQPERDRAEAERAAEEERRLSEINRQLQNPENKWGGEVDEKVEITILEDEFIRAFEGRSYYAPTSYLHYFKATNGLWYSALTYDDSTITIGDQIRGTIKSLDIDQRSGRRITRLSRIKQIGHEDNPRLISNVHKLKFGN